MRLILTEADVAEGCAALAVRCPRMAHAHALAGVPPVRERRDGFAGLLKAIVSQQVSVAAADAIWSRLEAAGLHEPGAILAATDEALRAPGLSRNKARYARALAEARIDWGGLRGAPTEEVIEVLTAVPGVGVWTAEVYALFALGHADVFAPGDLALQEGARMLYGLDERPKERALRAMAEDWAPWRAVAARLLWAYYAHQKGREGVTA
ncbi:DNA-3-methyladenine glycosylase II [Hasllibacter halocynthiae]|uniref:DNA-3-methyladenine glycosylase II n=1 Tax=Hasllibacter halocynthiae TaxID=595589 RepID=A0A2T0X8H6_9RHOB|nr:DNA-3-methyladenine glycosylase [Hasllibacter halocynthiae]PRY95229.1 DNA-3-methyladenine glycosylase II [Hasllibacter halocynthiae]